MKKIFLINLLLILNLSALDITSKIEKVDSNVLNNALNNNLSKEKNSAILNFSDFKNKNLNKKYKKKDNFNSHMINVKIPVRDGFILLKTKNKVKNNQINKVKIYVEVPSYKDKDLLFNARLERIINKRKIVKNLSIEKIKDTNYINLPIKGNGKYTLFLTISKKTRYGYNSVKVVKKLIF